jgi:hypothetical protein
VFFGSLTGLSEPAGCFSYRELLNFQPPDEFSWDHCNKEESQTPSFQSGFS